MCGIAGLVDPGGVRPDDTDLVDGMLRTLAHRGPDDHVVYAAQGAVLGTRRLSIIDLAGGRQPLANEDGTVIAAQNGEIYNYVELRRELLRRSHRLRSSGDTETLVHLYEDHGERLVEHLRGMFAFAIWDSARRRLVLARDRVGKKPLYWRLAGGRLSFGSELKALLADPSLDRVIDDAALETFLGFQYVPSPLSILVGVHKLEPASVLVWDGGEPRIERYWEPSYEPKEHRSLEDDRDACLEQLRDAVRIRLRSDVPVGSFLSGGLDSSVITGLMAQLSPEPVRTFTIGFDDPLFDERAPAEAVARHFSTRHTSEVLKLDAVDLLAPLAAAFDEPFGDPSAIPTLRVAQLASQELKVVLTGDGGDELFAGYPRYVVAASRERLGVTWGTVVGPLARSAARALALVAPASRFRARVATVADMADMDSDGRYDRLMRVMAPRIVEQLLGRSLTPSAGPVERVLRSDRRLVGVDRLLRADLLTYLPEDLLVKVDRATMATSLEARSPFLDQELIAFAGRLPIERKLQRGRAKVLLREVAREILPAHLIDRPKQGFGVPLDDWFLGPLGRQFQELALAPDAFLRNVVEVGEVRRLHSEHVGGRRAHGRHLWQLLSLELWGRRWANGPTTLAQAATPQAATPPSVPAA